MVEGPVPVVIVKLAKVLCASVDLVPHGTIKGHAHVVLGTDPLRHLDLGIKDLPLKEKS